MASDETTCLQWSNTSAIQIGNRIRLPYPWCPASINKQLIAANRSSLVHKKILTNIRAGRSWSTEGYIGLINESTWPKSQCDSIKFRWIFQYWPIECSRESLNAHSPSVRVLLLKTHIVTPPVEVARVSKRTAKQFQTCYEISFLGSSNISYDRGAINDSNRVHRFYQCAMLICKTEEQRRKQVRLYSYLWTIFWLFEK